MEKNKIRFSHEYNKLSGNDGTATLMAVFKTHYDELGETFKEWDTLYNDFKSGEVKTGYFQLPETNLLVLLFIDNNGLFTTIRGWNKRKEIYYRSKIGEEFEIVK